MELRAWVPVSSSNGREEKVKQLLFCSVFHGNVHQSTLKNKSFGGLWCYYSVIAVIAIGVPLFQDLNPWAAPHVTVAICVGGCGKV